MAPKLSGGFKTDGVIVYEDHQDKQQFHYLPANARCILGDTLQDFKVTYWGIGDSFFAQDSSGAQRSIVGAVLSGRAAIDIAESQEKSVKKQIKTIYNIDNPKLLPLILRKAKVQSVVAGNTIGIAGGDSIFPETVVLGSTFSYTVGTGQSLFAQFIATQSVDDRNVTPNPNFALNVVGDVEFVGDPWTVKVTADLSQVWSKIRSHFDASVDVGWFSTSAAEFNSIVANLVKTQVIKCEFEEGSLDNEKYGRQIFEMGKEICTAISNAVVSQTGLFKFEANPEPPSLLEKVSPMGLFDWGVSVNASYSAAYFKQSINFQQKISYTGRFLLTIPTSMTLAVDCNSSTGSHFTDLANSSVPCITQAKADKFNKRVRAEVVEKQRKLLRLAENLENGKITPEAFTKLVDFYNQITLTEDTSPANHPDFEEFLRQAIAQHNQTKEKGSLATKIRTEAPPSWGLGKPYSRELLDFLEQEIIEQNGK